MGKIFQSYSEAWITIAAPNLAPYRCAACFQYVHYMWWGSIVCTLDGKMIISEQLGARTEMICVRVARTLYCTLLIIWNCVCSLIWILFHPYTIAFKNERARVHEILRLRPFKGFQPTLQFLALGQLSNNHTHTHTIGKWMSVQETVKVYVNQDWHRNERTTDARWCARFTPAPGPISTGNRAPARHMCRNSCRRAVFCHTPPLYCWRKWFSLCGATACAKRWWLCKWGFVCHCSCVVWLCVFAAHVVV